MDKAKPAPDSAPRAGADPVAIFSFGGDMPVHVAEAAIRNGYKVKMVAFRGYASKTVEQFPCEWIRLGQVGKALRAVRNSASRHIVIVGAITRPNIADLSLDLPGLMRLPAIWKLLRSGGDDSVLRRIAAFFDQEGIRVTGVQEIAPEFLANAGAIAGQVPSPDILAEARKGLAALDALSPFDGGQALVMVDGRPVAIEGIEGTDEMLARIADLRTRGKLRLTGRHGFLVKAAKKGQDLRLDMPTIGLRTLDMAASAQLQGIIVEAGNVLLADRQALIDQARKFNLFIYGIDRSA